MARTLPLIFGLLTVPSMVFAKGGPMPAGDVAHGHALFLQTCALCHLNGQDNLAAGQGPVLAGVFERPAASVPNFGYTAALQASHLKWDEATLNRFLANPGAAVPGTAMPLPVPDENNRRDLIAYLATLPRVPALERVAAAPAASRNNAGDYTQDAPGREHYVRVADLPRAYATESARNSPKTVPRPEGATLKVPADFTLQVFADHLRNPRLIRVAPNGDIFVAETAAGRIHVFRAADGAGKPAQEEVFAAGLHGPFGIAFHPAGPDPQWIYIAELNEVIRFPYHTGDLKAAGSAQTIVPHLSDTTGGHTTRDLVFTPDDRRLLISVGSGSNIADQMDASPDGGVKAWEAARMQGAAWGTEENRANVLWTDPEGSAPLKIYACGIRNPVGMAISPATGDLWVSVNERDGLGDDLVPDYITHVKEGGYYGWPWYYLGNHEDPRPRLRGTRPDLAGKAIVPDVLIQAHSASLQLAFYPSTASGPAAFPAQYRGDIFAAEHGSWNRSVRTGTKVIRVRLDHGVATGKYEDFLTGFNADNGHVWGRPVGVAVAHDGALLVSDDAGGKIWRIAYAGGVH